MVYAPKIWNCEYIDLYDRCPSGEAEIIDLSLMARDTKVDRKSIYTIGSAKGNGHLSRHKTMFRKIL
jgi:hypothetical protein